jgi:quercetin dioxygenase-like cupin family protein
VESIYTLDGEGEYTMLKTGEKVTSHPGGFVRMPAHMVHKVRCTSHFKDCVIFIHTAQPFDIHIVDEHGKPVAEAGAKQK